MTPVGRRRPAWKRMWHHVGGRCLPVGACDPHEAKVAAGCAVRCGSAWPGPAKRGARGETAPGGFAGIADACSTTMAAAPRASASDIEGGHPSCSRECRRRGRPAPPFRESGDPGHHRHTRSAGWRGPQDLPVAVSERPSMIALRFNVISQTASAILKPGTPLPHRVEKPGNRSHPFYHIRRREREGARPIKGCVSGEASLGQGQSAGETPWIPPPEPLIAASRHGRGNHLCIPSAVAANQPAGQAAPSCTRASPTILLEGGRGASAPSGSLWLVHHHDADDAVVRNGSKPDEGCDEAPRGVSAPSSITFCALPVLPATIVLQLEAFPEPFPRLPAGTRRVGQRFA